MDPNAKRFARRVLLVNGLLLLIVLATVAAAAREIYRSTRDEMISQAKERQVLLAKQTANGIQSHYQSILNDLDLMHRADGEEPGTDKARETLVQRATNHAVAGRTPLIGQVMWKQLDGRVSLLFSVDHVPPNGPGDAHVIGTNDPKLVAGDILQKSKQWISQLQSPSISTFEIDNGMGENLICVPKVRGRDLIAVVPISGIESEFFKTLNANAATRAWLIDTAGNAMAASRPELVGIGLANISDVDLKEHAMHYIAAHATGSEAVPRKFQIGNTAFSPSIVTAVPVAVGDKQWELFVSTSLEDVDGVVAQLFHRALWWCIFVVVSVTAILVSTAVLMIRTRIRMERLQHEALTKELGQAREIQLAWLPAHQPKSAAIDVAAVNSPASHISGDFYNWFELPDGRLAVTVGDVTGHGMAAAFLMATTQLLVRNTLASLGDPGRCLEEVNRQLCVQVFNGQFVTMLLLVLDVANGRMQIATAGHPAPLLADGESFQPLPLEPQLVLGVDHDTQYVTEHFDLASQASLLLYTDGVVECPDRNDARFSTERLRRTLYGRYDAAQEMLDAVMNAVNTFRGSRVLDDDLTLVAVQLQSVSASRQDVDAIAI